MDRSTSERTSACSQMAAVYWSPGGNFLAVPENKHISIMNIRGEVLWLHRSEVISQTRSKKTPQFSPPECLTQDLTVTRRLRRLGPLPFAGLRPSARVWILQRAVRTDQLLRACWWDGWTVRSAGCRSQCKRSTCA